MENTHTKKEILDAASRAYSDPKVKQNEEVVKIIFEFAKEVEATNNLPQLCVRKGGLITNSQLLYVKTGIPKTLHDLDEIIGETGSDYNYSTNF